MTAANLPISPPVPVDENVLVVAVKGELIEDLEVDNKEKDRLGHRQIAQQLADLAVSVPESSNIALYGAWGSGKSGIGNLLRDSLKGKTGFARFDAFKYAENPLRRNFISAVAAELDVDDPKFHRDLYTGSTTTTFDVPPAALKKMALIYLGSAFGIFGLLLVVVAIAAALQAGPWWADFRSIAKDAVVAALTPAALLAALVVLAGKALGVERKTDKADSSEQFEELFRELIKEAGKSRIVVFVDELDRCAAGDVVATLEAVRTFLGNDGCVFVVAADRQVIEEALTEKLKQATPADPVNPYYSSGSAYLDKVFQYQMMVPPLLPASVTRYAVDLTRPLPGIWTELADGLALTVSVLVPSHVRSPRRVKNLLNAFVLTYRLAEARARAGRLHGEMPERADEIARLVCLRVEFPLFARDLVLDARLPEYVLRLHDREPESAVWADHPYVTDQVKQLARGYAGLQMPVATMLNDRNLGIGGDSEAQREDDVLGDDGEGDSGDAEAAKADSLGREVERQHGRQLVEYLSRTRSVTGPGRDLLFMQSTGSAVGLDGQLAERLEEAAANGAVRELLATTHPFDSAEKEAVLALLLDQSRQALGLEARNVAVSLLAVAGAQEFDIASRADALADALAPAVTADPTLVGASGLPGAWRLGLNSERPTARDLRRLVLNSSAAQTDLATGLVVLKDADAALDADAGATAKLLAHYLLSLDDGTAAAIADVLLTLRPETVTRLIQASGEPLTKGLLPLLEPPKSTTVAPAAPAPPVAARIATAPEPEDGEEPEPADPAEVVSALSTLLEALDDRAAQALTSVLLAVNTARARDIVEAQLDKIGPVDDPELAAGLLAACARRAASIWPKWTAPVTPVAAQETATVGLQRLADRLWEMASQENNPSGPDDVRTAAAAVVSLLEHREPQERPSIAAAVRTSLDAPATDDDAAAARTECLRVAGLFIDAGMLQPHVLVAKESEDLDATLRNDLPEQASDDPLVRYVSQSVHDLLAGWPRAGIQAAPATPEQAQSLADALHACNWLPEPDATLLRLLSRRWENIGQDLLPPLPTATFMDNLRSEHGAVVDDAIADWISLAQPDAESLLLAVAAARDGSDPSPDLLASIRQRTDTMSAKERLTVLTGVLGDINRPAPSAPVLQAAGAATLPDTDVAKLLVKRYEECTNNTQRRHLLEAWEHGDITSDGARKKLFQNVLISLFKPKDEGGNAGMRDLGIEFLTRLADTQPAGMKRPLGDAVVRAIGEERAGKVLKPIGYKVTKSGVFRRRTDVETN
jgi:hypothetical protein